MKIEEYCKTRGLWLIKIRYKHQFGYIKRKGFDIRDNENKLLLEVEPCFFSNGDKWHIKLNNTGKSMPSYFKKSNHIIKYLAYE